MSNPLKQPIGELNRILLSLHELDWFHTLGNNVNYSNPAHTGMVKPKVDHVIGGLSVLYLFAVFEYYFSVSHWSIYIDPDDLMILRAYRHVRHSIAHGYHGKRAKRNKTDLMAFDYVIQRDLFHPKNVITLDSSTDEITILPSIGIFLRQFMQKIAQYVFAKVVV